MNNMVLTQENEINQVINGKPHLVILGAGASYAAFPDGDKNGRKLPLMNNFIETLGLEELIKSSGIKFESNNFEIIYDRLRKDSNLQSLCLTLEKQVYNYFAEMELPDNPTLYDHLLLSLREKDFIATFNWDPFLVQAYRRNGRRFKLPRLLFLHGNVEVGYCPNGHTMGNKGSFCSSCGEQFKQTQLLYPISEKNYHLDEFISRQWATLQDLLKHTFMITIFGYDAPSSDARAIELMKSAWGDVEKRQFEETEIIDVRNKDDLHDTWKPFIHTHHYRTEKDFYNSWIANHPRRTLEAYWNQYIEAKFIDNNPLPKDADFEELWKWFEKLQKVEGS
ncbi:MAG: hypothetical protein AB7D29_01490 [Campylobacterales bacterium]